MRKIATGIVAGLGCAVLALSGCSSQQEDAGQDTGKPAIVATTSVYADIARQVAGDDAQVTAIVDSTSQDPHSYEATAQDKLKISRADLVVLNGGGYDPFMSEAAEGADGKVIDAVAVSGLPGAAEAAETQEHDHDHDDHDHADHDHGEFNEHVWYDVSAMKNLTHAISEDLGSIDEQHRQDYHDRAQAYEQKLDELSSDLKGIGASGRTYLATEPVPDRLLDAAGMKNETPEAFSSAVEAESDVPAATLNEVHRIVDGGSLDLLAFNPQTETAQTRQLRSAAESARVPVVDFTETLPEGQDYLSWMRGNIENLRQALA